MRGVKRVVATFVGTISLLSAGDVTEAPATTICVPDFSSACPNSGGNVAVSDLEQAMSTKAADGIPDEVLVQAGTYTENASFEPVGGSAATFELEGSDPLTVVGAGPAATTMTSAGTGNVYLVNLAFPPNSRQVTIRDLTMQAPASFQDGAGAGVQLAADVLENVDVISLNPGTDGVKAYGPGNVFRDGEVRGEGPSGSIDFGIASTVGNTDLIAEDDKVIGASWALLAEGKASSLTARRVAALGTETLGGAADNAGALTLENSIITVHDGIGLFASPAADPVHIDADHVTIVDLGDSPTYPALEAKKFGSTEGNGSIEVSNSIVRGFAAGYKAETPIGPGVGTVSIEARYSNLRSDGTNVNGSVDFSEGNIDADPLLTPDYYSLPPGSPSIDAGDPAPGGLSSDFEGAPRPIDGDGDGIARTDQGAWEYQRPARIEMPRPGGGSGNADTTPPQTTIAAGPGGKLARGRARFRFSSSEPGSSFECRLDRGKAKRCASPKRYRGLRPGRHVFRVWATDQAGNKDPTAAKRSFRVPAP